MLNRVSLLPKMGAILFDLDGVLTPTAEVHQRAWSQLFTDFLATQDAEPYGADDYFRYIDGKPRYEGVAALLRARGIELPWGTSDDGVDEMTVCGLGNRKNTEFAAILHEQGVEPYPGSIRFLDALAALDIPVAVVSSSRNAPAVLEAAGIRRRFPVVVDGSLASELGLPGKPQPDTYRYAAQQLGVPVQAAVVVEDAESGVASGYAGRFGLVIGVDRGAGAATLFAHGADVVVSDLEELVPVLAH